MCRRVKEELLTFEGKPLFPERRATTLPYQLSDGEMGLYEAVTHYVRDEMGRADQLKQAGEGRRGNTVGFALTVLQRRLASSPEAILRSLERRRDRLTTRLLEAQAKRSQLVHDARTDEAFGADDADDVDDALYELGGAELENLEDVVVDAATASRTADELRVEISVLDDLVQRAKGVRFADTDRKWTELRDLLLDQTAMFDHDGERRKILIFTEHRDTLNYLIAKIRMLLGRDEIVATIHGGVKREDRRAVQDRFRQDPALAVLLATDAAGEGINLQRAHLMVNYDLPWNPNRIEQRFGRIHRIGQTEVCHLWNLVAEETREGDVYRTLLEKLEQARESLGGQVFDVLGRLQFEGRSLRELLIEAVRYGERPEVQARLTYAVADAVRRSHLQDLLEERALAHDVMDASRVARVREDMERAEARRLQPHYIESFFLEAFTQLGGTTRQREARRYEVTHVPAPVRNRDRLIGTGEPVLPRYERIAFEKSLIAPQGEPLAAFVCPGHPLLDATLDLTLDRHRDLLRRGTVLIDESDPGTTPRVLFYLEHAIQDASLLKNGDRRTISKQMLYVEMDATGQARHIHYAPYLDYRPLLADEPGVEVLFARPESAWITRDLEQKALAHAIAEVVPEHLKEVRDRRSAWIDKARAAVKDRLTKEIGYWDHRAQDLKLQEQAGKPNARLNSQEASRRADDLQARLQKRMGDLDLEAQVSALPPVALGGFVVVPAGLLAQMAGRPLPQSAQAVDTQASAARARAVVMEIERNLGFEPTDREFDKLGYVIESREPHSGRLRFLEVKGRISGAATITE